MAEEQIKTLVGLGLPEEQVRLHFVIPFFFFLHDWQKKRFTFCPKPPDLCLLPPVSTGQRTDLTPAHFQ